MRIGSDIEYIEIEEIERILEGFPCAGDVRLRVSLSLQEFRGSYDGIWLDLTEVESFLDSLSVLDEERQGIARIVSISPGEFIFEIRSSDKSGHMEIEVQLRRYQYSGTRYWPIYLSGGFQVQPDAIKQLIVGFKSFIKEAK
ncbi:hypothetical protein KKF34_18025 [Myxococcota bacterium]|nr:hypothetical protein [Myxococcota bacterium]MBU1381181.1 hypothetical protein [Myxococcota bacterium]MBU1498783.1 hypothetical protein [Myxococcota bacterium]